MLSRDVGYFSLQMTFDVFLHRVAVLVGGPTGAGSGKRATIRRDAWDPLYDGVPGDMRSGGDNWWVWGVHHNQVTAVESTREIRSERGMGNTLCAVHTTPTFRCIPMVGTSTKRTG